MTNEMILLLVLLVLLVGILPTWPYSVTWDYRPSGVLVILLLIFFVWILTENRPLFRNTSQDVKGMVQDVGVDIKAAGREAADSIRKTIQ